jgi:chemotaxis protein CheZ
VLGDRISDLVDHLRNDDSDAVSLSVVASVSEVLITTMRRYFDSLDTSLYNEFRSLADYIDNAKDEIGKLRPQELKSERLPHAGRQLDAVVKATEEATQTIMDSAEEIMGGDKSDDDYGATVDDACMRIIQACSFQDITGQRITKVVETLTYIEERLAVIERTWASVANDSEPDEDEKPKGDAALLNGPQLEGEGIDQTAVDALLDEDDATPGAEVIDGAGQSSQSDIDALFD